MEPAPPKGDSKEATHLDLAVVRARRGFRRDTEMLVELLDDGMLLVALAGAADEPSAEDAELMTLTPRLVTTDTGEVLIPVFTNEDHLGVFAAELGWSTRDHELSYCSLSLRATLDAALELVQGGHCKALVINPMDEHELLLQPRELDALRQGQPIPLVGYVRELAVSPDETTVVSKLETIPEPALLDALQHCLSDFPGVLGYRLEQTLNRERDVDPHPTLTLATGDSAELDQDALRQRLRVVFEEQLPAPGYIDVVFEEARGAP